MERNLSKFNGEVMSERAAFAKMLISELKSSNVEEDRRYQDSKVANTSKRRNGKERTQISSLKAQTPWTSSPDSTKQ